MEEVSQNQRELCGGVGAIAEDERHDKHDSRRKISTKKNSLFHTEMLQGCSGGIRASIVTRELSKQPDRQHRGNISHLNRKL